MIRNLFFVILLFFCSVFTAFGQGHLTFKGIEMNCSTSSFAEKLSLQGFSKLYESSNFCKLEGNFAGEPADIILLGDENSHLIKDIIVVFEKCTSWATLKYNYLLFKKTLQEKYGNGDSREYFSGSYYEGDGFELQAVKLEKCHFSTKFETASGDIIVAISKDCTVELYYIDKIASELEKQNKDIQRYNDL